MTTTALEVSAFTAPAPLATVAVTGADRLAYLDAVTSQRLTDLEPGSARAALELDARGAPIAVMDVVALADRVLLLVPDELAGELVERLGGRTFLSDAAFERLDAQVWSLRGGDAATPAAAVDLDLAPGAAVDRDGVVAVGRAAGLDLAGAAAAVAAVVASLHAHGAAAGGPDDLEAWRVATGEPRWGREIVAPHLPEELGLLPTHVDLAKGCYPGQEAVAHMWNLGRPRRRLALVATSDGVTAGWETGAGKGKVVVTSAAAGRPALALVPGDAVAGQRFAGNAGGEVEVLRLVGADLPVPGSNPAVTRRRDRHAG